MEILHNQDSNGHFPFREWMRKLRDKLAFSRILLRLRQIESGNIGDAQSLGEGVIELRIHVGGGHRVYFARHGEKYILLLCGGDKNSQSKDIEKAKSYWNDWKRRQI